MLSLLCQYAPKMRALNSHSKEMGTMSVKLIKTRDTVATFFVPYLAHITICTCPQLTHAAV